MNNVYLKSPFQTKNYTGYLRNLFFLVFFFLLTSPMGLDAKANGLGLTIPIDKSENNDNINTFFADVLPSATHPKFVNQLPNLPRIDATNGGAFKLDMEQSQQWLGLVDANGTPMNSTVWGYSYGGQKMYLGPTFVTQKDVPITVKWRNKLPNAHILPVDKTFHVANPTSGIPTVPHLHGGHVESASDGGPDSWFTQGFAEKGAEWAKKDYYYPNDQEGAPLWYHDHTLGYTRLNVYAGLAGMYLLRDNNELSKDLPTGEYERELVIQDKQFSANGEMYFPALLSDPEALDFPTNPNIEPTIYPEFFGDYILVNGMAWPKLDVKPTKYRFRLVNASDSRFYIFKLSNNGTFQQIGTDGGLLNNPVDLNQLVLAPGERADIIVDFSNMSGQSITLENIGPDEPFKGLAANQPPADPATTGKIMQFQVSGTANQTFNIPYNLRQPIQYLGAEQNTRQLLLLEGMDQFGRLKPSLGTAALGQLGYTATITENPTINTTEVWEVYNNTEDAHPIHIHQISFQLVNRQEFTGDLDPNTSALSNIQMVGAPKSPAANEQGWKDTYIVPPGHVARFKVRFDIPGIFVWHCHILSHEDWDMMRPFEVVHSNPCDSQGGDNDGDGICNDQDNCRDVYNPDQADADNNGIGDVCEGGGTTADCSKVTASADNNSITVSGLNAKRAIVEYISASSGYVPVEVCNANCTNERTFNVAPGDYTIKVQLFGHDGTYCYTERNVTVGGANPCDSQGGDTDGDGVCNNQDNCSDVYNPDQEDADNNGIGDACETSGGGSCNDAIVVGGDGEVNISTIAAGAKVEISGPSTGWGQQLVCEGNCGTSQVVNNLTPGSYNVTIQSFNPYCYNRVTVTVTSGGNPCDSQGGDTDSDGICNNQDNCPNTPNPDQADGDNDGVGDACETGGGGTCNDAVVVGGTGQVNISTIAAGAKVEISGPATNWAQQLVCEGNCGTSQVVNNLTAGSYNVTIQSFNPYCYNRVTVSVTDGGGNPCDAQGGDNDGDGICNNQDNCRDTYNPDQEDADNDGVGDACEGGGGTDCDVVSITQNNNDITIDNITAPISIVKIFDPYYNTILDCSGNCGSTQTISNLANGRYLVKVIFYTANWQYVCEKEEFITIGGASSRSAPILDFTAFRADRAVELQWVTNTTYKNAYYEIEKSTDGQTFEALQQIANDKQVEDIAYHESLDKTPEVGENFYRLKQVYLDGTFDYTEVKVINFQIDLEELSVFPNPVQDDLFINLKPYAGKKGNLKIVNQYGQLIKTVEMENIPTHPIKIDLKNFGNGMYFLTMDIEKTHVAAKKILVARMY